jgi:ferredoxin
MTAKIYWFSGTGNSLAVARALAENLPDAELFPVAGAVQHPPEAADVIGLVFPVYAFGPPAVVERFIRKLKVNPDAYVFSVCTCAVTSGSTLHFIRNALLKRGIKLSAAWTVRQPENYPPLGGTPGAKSQARTHAEADKKTAHIANALQARSTVFEKAGLLWRLSGRLIWPAFRFFEKHGADRLFRADKKCNGCGICAKVCPVANISMENGRPVWLRHCEQCFACFHWCPQNAVQYGFSSRLRRYHHPRTALADFTDQGVSNE